MTADNQAVMRPLWSFESSTCNNNLSTLNSQPNAVKCCLAIKISVDMMVLAFTKKWMARNLHSVCISLLRENSSMNTVNITKKNRAIIFQQC